MDEARHAVEPNALFSGILDSNPQRRCDAAIALGDAWKAGGDGLPRTTLILEEVARADAMYPGVADTFYETVKWDISGDEWRSFPPWMLCVLKTRRRRRQLTTPGSSNGLEFHVHDHFDDDASALAGLLSWGYVDVVEWALDHRSIPPRYRHALMTSLHYDHGSVGAGVALAIEFGELVKSVCESWPKINLDGVNTVIHSQYYGVARPCSATWLFPVPTAPLAALPVDDGDRLFDLLRQAGVSVRDQVTVLDVAQLASVPLPTPVNVGVGRYCYTPRSDVALDVVLDSSAETIVAIRLIQAQTQGTA